MMQQQQLPPSAQTGVVIASTSNSAQMSTQSQPQTATEAPPKQVALAMERLGQAGRLIADIRLGADRLLEAIFVAAQPHQGNKPLQLFVKEDATMRQHLQDLRSIGRQLEESGVLNDSLRSRSNTWGLHMPLVCPDGAVVAYAWKRQLAGQAGASAVDRTRLALKAFTDQKRRFFPHLDDGLNGQSSGTGPASKKQCHSTIPALSIKEELADCRTLSDVLSRLEKEVQNVKVFTYQRLEWLKRASSLPSTADERSTETSREHTFHGSSKLRSGTISDGEEDKVAVIELLVPSVFRAVISLHPAGSVDPDAVAFFSPDEGGSHIHARGSSVYNAYRHITEHATMALQYFLGSSIEAPLYYLLHWVCSYESLFTRGCSKCGRIMSMNKQSALFLPPVRRQYRQYSVVRKTTTQQNSITKDQNSDGAKAYHISCYSEEV